MSKRRAIRPGRKTDESKGRERSFERKKPFGKAPKPGAAKKGRAGASAKSPARPPAKVPEKKIEQKPVKAPAKPLPRPLVIRTPAPAPPIAPSAGPARSGFALLLGRPNVGKSTLLNALVGEHLAIVSPRPQTTRNRILGIVTAPGTQLCLVDTPGVHKAKGLLNQAMVRTALGQLGEVDVVLFLAEAGWPSHESLPVEQIDPVGPFHRELLADVARSTKPVLLVLTKIDLIPKPLLLPLIQAWAKAFPFREVYPLSAMTGENVAGFVEMVRAFLPEGEPLFPAETITDQAERALCGELIREQIFLQTRDEIPYGTAVSIEAFDESERIDDPARPGAGLVRIAASIVVERDSHKAIVIGHGGDRLKEIGTSARKAIEKLLGCRIWLDLHVRVIPGWTEKRGLLAELGLDVT